MIPYGPDIAPPSYNGGTPLCVRAVPLLRTRSPRVDLPPVAAGYVPRYGQVLSPPPAHAVDAATGPQGVEGYPRPCAPLPRLLGPLAWSWPR